MKPTNKLLINDGNRFELRGKFWLIPTESSHQDGNWLKGFKVVGFLEDSEILFQRVWLDEPKLTKITNEELRGIVGEVYTSNDCFVMEY